MADPVDSFQESDFPEAFQIEGSVNDGWRNQRFGAMLPQPKADPLRRSDFPNGFVFGAASSAFQFEGAANADGKGPSICDTFAKRKGLVAADKNGIEGVNHYYRYKEDVRAMRKIGLGAYIFSISWSRVLPNGKRNGGKGENQKGIDFYNHLINRLLANDIEPYVILLHFDPPQALEDEYGGFLNPQIVNDFRDYADLCFSKFGDRVKHWITINEPWGFSFGGYAVGTLAPGRGNINPKISSAAIKDHLLPSTRFSCREAFTPWHVTGESDSQTSLSDTKDRLSKPSRNFVELIRWQHNPKDGDPGREPYIVSHHQLLAHAKAVDLYKKKYKACQNGKIGINLGAVQMVPYTESQSDKNAAERALDFMFGKFMEPLMTGNYPKSLRERVGSRLPHFSQEESNLVKGSFDFIGLNYYTANYVKDAPDLNRGSYLTDAGVKYYTECCGKPIGEKGGSSWLYSCPRGLMDLLLCIKNKYKNPVIYITENGFVEKNDGSVKLREALFDTQRVSYHYNHLQYLKKAIKQGAKVDSYFVWSLHDNYEWGSGYKSRFGINYVDHDDNKERYPKFSAGWFNYFLKKEPSTPKAQSTSDEKYLKTGLPPPVAEEKFSEPEEEAVCFPTTM